MGASGKWAMMNGVPVTNSDKKVPMAKRRPCYRGTPYKRVILGGGGSSSKEGSSGGGSCAISIQNTVTGKKVKSADWVNDYLLPPLSSPPRSSGGGGGETATNQSSSSRPPPMEEYYFYQPEEGISIFEYPLADPPIEVRG